MIYTTQGQMDGAITNQVNKADDQMQLIVKNNNQKTPPKQTKTTTKTTMKQNHNRKQWTQVSNQSTNSTPTPLGNKSGALLVFISLFLKSPAKEQTGKKQWIQSTGVSEWLNW